MTGAGSDQTPGLTRRRALGLGAGALLAGGVGGGTVWRQTHQRPIPDLYSETVALRSATERELVPPGRTDLLLPGSRVLQAAPDAPALQQQEQAWLASSAAWTRSLGADNSLARSALLDLRVLTVGLSATVAGWSEPWRYVWPRDSSATAVALATAGHPAEAITTLRYLQSVQRSDGWFEARYLPGTQEAPDDRERQLDGSGWVLWAAQQVRQTLPPQQGDALVRSLGQLVRRSVGRIITSTNTPDHLPAPSPDYWEVDEEQVTLGTVAPMLAGLEAAAALLATLDEEELAAEARTRHTQLAGAIATAFGDHGYPRHAGGNDPDAAIAFLLPPFAAQPPEGAFAALTEAIPRMLRPAGGLAPGAGWRDDGISWTPETAATALACASTGHEAAAQRWLAWLSAHRTSAGSFPEKVLADGSPAAVAPLTWTAAFTLLTLHALHPPTT